MAACRSMNKPSFCPWLWPADPTGAGRYLRQSSARYIGSWKAPCGPRSPIGGRRGNRNYFGRRSMTSTRKRENRRCPGWIQPIRWPATISWHRHALCSKVRIDGRRLNTSESLKTWRVQTYQGEASRLPAGLRSKDSLKQIIAHLVYLVVLADTLEREGWLLWGGPS